MTVGRVEGSIDAHERIVFDIPLEFASDKRGNGRDTDEGTTLWRLDLHLVGDS